LDLGTARELIDAPAEVSEPIMRRAEAGETISQEEVKAAIRIRRADCIPVTLPPRPAIKLVSASQSPFAEPPTKEPLIATSGADVSGVIDVLGPPVARTAAAIRAAIRLPVPALA
jgi:hypothetical protein